jgi:hypothetical protein
MNLRDIPKEPRDILVFNISLRISLSAKWCAVLSNSLKIRVHWAMYCQTTEAGMTGKLDGDKGNLQKLSDVLARAAQKLSGDDAATLLQLSRGVLESEAAREISAAVASIASNLTTGSPTYTAVHLPNQDDGFDWAISEDGNGLVLGLDGKPARHQSKESAEFTIQRMTPPPRPRAVGFAKSSEMLSLGLGQKLKTVSMRKDSDAEHTVALFVRAKDWHNLISKEVS